MPEAKANRKVDVDTLPDIILEFASTGPEREVLDGWVGREHPDGVRIVADHGRELAGALTGDGGDPLVTPVRVAWLPRERRGTRTATLADLVAGRNPRRPSEAAQRRILRREPDCCVAVLEPVATGAWTVEELDDRIAEVRGRYVAALADWPG